MFTTNRTAIAITRLGRERVVLPLQAIVIIASRRVTSDLINHVD